MALLNASELRRYEVKYSDGLSSDEVVRIFQAKGEKFSEATLRKYVQLGLLPTSRRVGLRGKNRGSSGVYPVIILRLANEIKKALESGQTLDDLSLGFVGLTGELLFVERAVAACAKRFAAAIQQQPQSKRAALKKAFDKHCNGVGQEIRDLQKLAERFDLTNKK